MKAAGGKVFFVGAGPGDPELLTLKGRRIIEESDVVIYADSLVNPEVCSYARPGAEVHCSSSLTLEEIARLMIDAAAQGKSIARVHTGDPGIFGALAEQMDILDEEGIPYEIIPGVSSIFAAAASLGIELTRPEVSQTVIITRLGGRTPVPASERLNYLAQHNCTLALFLSVAMIDSVVEQLLEGGYSASTPIAVVYRASWQDERTIIATLEDAVEKVRAAGIQRQALILVGDVLTKQAPGSHGPRSKLYDAGFAHGFRKPGKKNADG